MHSSTGIPNNKSLHSFRFGIYVDLESKHCSQDTDMNLCECKMALLTGSLPADIICLQKCWNTPVGITILLMVGASFPSAQPVHSFILFCKNRSASCSPLLEGRLFRAIM